MARRTKEEAEKTRLAILNAAEKAFYKHGVTRTTLEQIATAAHVTRGAVYWHFKNKIELCEALMESVFLPQEEIMEQLASNDSATPLDDLKNSALDCMRQIAKDKRRQRVIAILFQRCEYVEEMAIFMKRRNKAKDRMLERSLRMFERAHHMKLLAPQWPPRTAAITFQSLIGGFITNAVEGRKAFDLSTTGITCIESFFQSITAR